MPVIKRMEKLVLAKICIETDGSKSERVPEHIFIKKFRDVKVARKALKKLISGGYVARHPTAGEMTNQMTQAGWDECRRIKEAAPRHISLQIDTIGKDIFGLHDLYLR